MRLGLCCNFYPAKDRLGTHSTSLALLLQRADPKLEMDLIVPRGSAWPQGFSRDRVRLLPSWRHGDPSSILGAALRLARIRGPATARLLNWFPTCFGETRSANAMGMLLPGVARAFSGGRTAVYAHNFIETQDVRRLGYHAGRVTRAGISLFEQLLARASLVIVPLESQAQTLRERHGLTARAIPIPFTEALFGHWSHGVPTDAPPPIRRSPPSPQSPYRILMFGVWGPQKDFENVLPVLTNLYREGRPLEIVLAGTINRFFPHYREKIDAALRDLPPEVCRFVPNPPDEQTPELFGNSDLVILPYNAIAGPSGVMGLAAFHDCRIIAYDVGELREYDAILRGGTVFVRPRDRDEMRRAVLDAMEQGGRSLGEPPQEKVHRAELAARELLSTLEAG